MLKKNWKDLITGKKEDDVFTPLKATTAEPTVNKETQKPTISSIYSAVSDTLKPVTKLVERAPIKSLSENVNKTFYSIPYIYIYEADQDSKTIELF